MARTTKRSLLFTSLVLALYALPGPGSAAAPREVADAPDEESEVTAPGTASGSLAVITYNVAGLPWPLSAGQPDQSSARIGELLADCDLALLQEDFTYHGTLRARSRLPYQSPPAAAATRLFGDGLALLSRNPLHAPVHAEWCTSHGILGDEFDSFGAKGLAAARLVLTAGVQLDIYDLHADAGRSRGDEDARRAQLAQLGELLEQRSKGRAVIVGGDFNLDVGSPVDRALLHEFCARHALRMAQPTPEVGCFDHVLFRSSTRIHLEVAAHRAGTEFVDAHGEPLSDHVAQRVQFRWQAGASEAAPRTGRPLPAGG